MKEMKAAAALCCLLAACLNIAAFLAMLGRHNTGIGVVLLCFGAAMLCFGGMLVQCYKREKQSEGGGEQ